MLIAFIGIEMKSDPQTIKEIMGLINSLSYLLHDKLKNSSNRSITGTLHRKMLCRPTAWIASSIECFLYILDQWKH